MDNIRSEDLAKELIRRAQEYEREAKKLFDAAKILNPNIISIDGPIQVEKFPPEPFFAKKTRREEIIAALAGKKGLKRKELRALLPDMPKNTFAHVLSHEKNTFIPFDGKWYLKGEEPTKQ